MTTTMTTLIKARSTSTAYAPKATGYEVVNVDGAADDAAAGPDLGDWEYYYTDGEGNEIDGGDDASESVPKDEANKKAQRALA